MSRAVFQSIKGLIFQKNYQRAQWAYLDQAQPTTASALENNVSVTCHGTLSSCSFRPVQNFLKKSIAITLTATESKRQFCSLSTHFKQFSTIEEDTFHRYRPMMDVPEGVFRGLVDRFNGITIFSKDEYKSNIDFKEQLKKSLDYWIERKYRTIWFHILTEHAEWIPHLAQNKFEFHHAKNGFAVMYRWLPTDENANVPVYAHTLIGVGGLVLNDKDEILVVKERYSLVNDNWKMPGGHVEPGENIVDAAIREVQEETGIKCSFKTIVSMRHSHAGGFGCSDIYVVVALTPQNVEYKCCDREIAQVKWMKIEEYLNHPNVHMTNRKFAKILLDYNKRGVRFTCEMSRHELLNKDYCMYYMKGIEDKTQNDKL